MYSKRLSVILMIKMALLLSALPAIVGCDGGSGGNDTNDNGTSGVTQEDFDELVTTTRTQSTDLNQATYDFGVAYEDLAAVVESTPDQEAAERLDRFIESGEEFEAAVASYNGLIQDYVEVVNASTSARTSNQTLFLLRGVTATIDPPIIDVPVGVSNQIQSARDAAAACEAQYPNAGTDDFEYAELLQCKKDATPGVLGSTATWGVGALLSGGAAVIVGGALAAGSAPVLIVVGGSIAVGAVVGAIWTACTGSSSSERAASAEGDYCAFNTAEGQVVELPDGSRAVSILLPPGQGSLVIQGPNGPIILEVTIPEDGLTVDLSGCTSDTSTFSTAEAAACNDLVTGGDTTNGNDNGNSNTNDNGVVDPVPDEECLAGDGRCDQDCSPADSDCETVPGDTGTGSCGDGVCDSAAGEQTDCPGDCPAVCGDGICNVSAGEEQQCPQDCPEVQCCVENNGCPSEGLFSCSEECCCCANGARCVQDSGIWVCGI